MASSKLQDPEFVLALKKKNDEAWAVFFEEASRIAINVVQSRFRALSSKEVEGIAADTFTKALKGIDNFVHLPRGSGLEGWVAMIAVNAAIDRIREINRERRKNQALKSGDSGPRTAPPLPVHIQGRRDPDHKACRDCLDAAIAMLGKDMGTAYRMYYDQQKSYREVAESLGEKLGTVKSWVSRATQRAPVKYQIARARHLKKLEGKRPGEGADD